ncbi:AAA family ATPase [Paenibacillus elgii]|uniref:AAA family ATPase n=1 Tax=Paenibacillus elgii TaxID=189691 RepID=UPI0013D608E2|nr:AAA family ATPase [Paenibacillus elgii]
MKINKLTVSNFGTYEGVVSFDFSSTNEKQNIILIGGRNGSGKTTIFNAIKIALYGHLAYGYKSVSQGYLNEIRINSNSLLKENVQSFVELDIELEEERGTSNYQLRREWGFEKGQLSEKNTIARNDITLTYEETLPFENYLKSFMPPQLFDLFFFDGEQISKFFLEGNVSKNIKEALNILRGYDTFNIIQTHLKRNIQKNIEKTASNEEAAYMALTERQEELRALLQDQKEDFVSIERQIKTVEDERQKYKTDFKNAGGLLAEEIVDLKAKLSQEEAYREERHEWLRNFANDILPFLMIPSLIEQVSSQLEKEAQFERHKNITSVLDASLFSSILQDSLIETSIKVSLSETSILAEKLASGVAEKVCPDFDVQSFVPIHSLSPDHLEDVTRLISDIKNRSVEEISRCKKEISESLVRTTEARLKLEKIDINDELNIISSKIQELDIQFQTLINRKLDLQNSIQFTSLELEKISTEIKRSVSNLTKIRKDKSVIALCLRTQELLDEMVPRLLHVEATRFKEYFFHIFGELMSKETLVDDIMISDDFEISLYRRELRTAIEIQTLLSKLGLEGMEALLGSQSISVLMDELGVSDKYEILKTLKDHHLNDMFELPVRVDIQTLSKGEQQIYIMALYWALIKVSDKNLPFVIDTPYARIDELHRDHITTRFFPSLSHQVIVLSTDSEVNEAYYRLLKPYVAKEYTISYSNEYKRTIVNEQYFFEVTT